MSIFFLWWFFVWGINWVLKSFLFLLWFVIKCFWSLGDFQIILFEECWWIKIAIERRFFFALHFPNHPFNISSNTNHLQKSNNRIILHIVIQKSMHILKQFSSFSEILINAFEQSLFRQKNYVFKNSSKKTLLKNREQRVNWAIKFYWILNFF
jgi:hypothetical protein